MIETGVLLLATGNINYACLAINLAISIRATSPSLPIALLTDIPTYNAMIPAHKRFFDSFVFVNPNSDACQNKLSLFQKSPFQNTLFLDADSIVSDVGNVEQIIWKLSKLPFYIDASQIRSTSEKDLVGNWCDYGNFRHMGLKGNIATSCNSSIIFFRKDELCENIFHHANKTYHEFKSKNVKVNPWLDVYIPDEPCFTVGMCVAGHNPTERISGLMTFFYANKPNDTVTNIRLFGHVISFPTGLFDLPKEGEKLYNDIMIKHCNTIKFKPFHYWKNKKQFAVSNRKGRR